MPRSVQDGEQLFVLRGGAADQVVRARSRRLQRAHQEVGRPVEGGSADVLPAVGAFAEVREEHRGVLPRGLPDGSADEEWDQGVDGLSGVRDRGSGRGDFGGESAAAGRGVGGEAGFGTELRVLLRVEEGEGGVHSLGRERFEQAFDLLQMNGVVVEGESAVAPHGREVLLVGQEADGARCFAAQRASHGCAGPPTGGGPGVPGVRHDSPSALSNIAHSE